MLTKPCGRCEMNAANWNIDTPCKFNPRGSGVRIGVGIVFSNVSFTNSFLHNDHSYRLLTNDHRSTSG